MLTATAWTNDLAQCDYVPANGGSTNTCTFAFTGGGMSSFGCAPVDPTFWMDQPGINVLITFTTPQDLPGVRLWGMNTDDSAAVQLNGVDYAMDSTSAAILPKVVCGASPGPNGVKFVDGFIVGANTPVEGNYSYSDVVLNATGVSSIRLSYVDGAGFGFAGALVECVTGVAEPHVEVSRVYPDPVIDVLHVEGLRTPDAEVRVHDRTGALVLRTVVRDGAIDLRSLSPGIYLVRLGTGAHEVCHRIVKQ